MIVKKKGNKDSREWRKLTKGQPPFWINRYRLMAQSAKHPVYVIHVADIHVPVHVVRRCASAVTRAPTRSARLAYTRTRTPRMHGRRGLAHASPCRENCAATYLSRPLCLRFYVRLCVLCEIRRARCGIAREYTPSCKIPGDRRSSTRRILVSPRNRILLRRVLSRGRACVSILTRYTWAEIVAEGLVLRDIFFFFLFRLLRNFWWNVIGRYWIIVVVILGDSWIDWKGKNRGWRMVLVNCITFFFNRFRYGNLLREIPVSNSYRGRLSTNWCLTRFCYFSKTSGKLKSIDRGLETLS